MSYLETAQSELDDFVNNLAKRIKSAKFSDSIIQQYWDVVAPAASENLDALIASRDQLQIRNEEEYKDFQAAIERAEFFLASSANDEFAEASWLIRASRTILRRFDAMNLLLPEENMPMQKSLDPLDSLGDYGVQSEPPSQFELFGIDDDDPPKSFANATLKPGRRSGLLNVYCGHNASTTVQAAPGRAHRSGVQETIY